MTARKGDMSDAPSADAMPSAPYSDDHGMLSRNSLGLSGLVILGIAYMGLALTAYFNFGIMEGLTGPVVPLAFAAVTALMLPTAASYAVMNSRRPSTGSTFTWLWEAMFPGVGIWLGWMLVITYIVGAILQPVMFGLFFNSLLMVFHVRASTMTAVAAGVFAVLIVGVLTRREVRLSASALVAFILIEAGFVAILAVYIIIRQAMAGRLTWQPMLPSHATSWSGFVSALLFAVLSIAAFDIIAPLAEESRTPRSLMPLATMLVTLGAGTYWVVTSFGIVTGAPPKLMARYVSSGQFTPIYLIAEKYVGVLKIMVPLTGFTASLAAMTAVSIAASRQLFALAREDLAPRIFAATSKRKNPWNALVLVLACCLVLPGLVTFYQHSNPMLAFEWIGRAYVFLILIPYTLTCVANIVYHLRHRAAAINWLTNLALPLAGIVINSYILYKDFLKVLVFHPTDFRTQTSASVACLLFAALAGVATLIGIRRAGGDGAAPYKLPEGGIAARSPHRRQ
jgi:amino acid transporter